MVIFAIFIVILIVFIAFILFKVLKEQKEFEKEEKKKNQEDKPEPVKAIEIMNDKKFEILLEEAKKDINKLEILERTIQDILRKSVKEKNVYNARICNMQLKRIDEIKDKKGI